MFLSHIFRRYQSTANQLPTLRELLPKIGRALDPQAANLYSLITKVTPQPIASTLKDDLLKAESDYSKFFASYAKTAANYKLLLQIQACQGKHKEAVDTFKKMKADGIPRSSEIYNTMISACAVVGNVRGAEKVLTLLQQAKLPLQAHTWAALARAYCNAGKLDGAFGVLTRMLPDVRPDVVVFTTLIQGAVKHGDVDRAWDALSHMRTYYCEPDEVTFTILIDACAKRKQVEKALQLWDDMHKLHLEPTNVTYDAIIRACASRADYADKAFGIFNQMRAKGFPASVYAFTALLKACATTGSVDEAQAVVLAMRQAEVPMSQPAYQTMLSTYARAAQKGTTKATEAMTAARQVFDGMIAEGIKPDVRTLNCMLNVYANACRINRATEFFESYEKVYGVPPDLVAHTTILSMYGHTKRFEKAVDWFAAMRKHGIAPNEFGFNAVLTACIRAQFMRVGVDIVREMFAQGLYPPNEVICRKLLPQARQEAPELAAWLAQRVPEPKKLKSGRVIKLARQLKPVDRPQLLEPPDWYYRLNPIQQHDLKTKATQFAVPPPPQIPAK